MINLESRVIRNEALLATEVDGEIVMMDVDSGNYYNLDAIGSTIWNQIGQPVPVSELCDRLAERFDADLATIRRDVLALFAQMEQKGLVRVA